MSLIFGRGREWDRLLMRSEPEWEYGSPVPPITVQFCEIKIQSHEIIHHFITYHVMRLGFPCMVYCGSNMVLNDIVPKLFDALGIRLYITNGMHD